jgi:diguanylate cyclase
MLPSELVEARLRRIFLDDAPGVLAELRQLIVPQAREIALLFYAELMELPESEPFLSHELVRSRLVGALAEWLRRLFDLGTPSQIAAFAQYQSYVGATHARVKIPPDLVLLGASILRRELTQRILAQAASPVAAIPTVVRANELLDCAMTLITDAYLRDVLRHEREGWALRADLSGPDGAVECERVRAALIDWQRQTVERLLAPEATAAPPALAESDFGQWLRHKGELLFTDPEMVGSLATEVGRVDGLVAEMLAAPDPGARRPLLARLDGLIANLGAALTWLSEEVRQRPAGPGGGAALLDDRYLPTVLQRHARTSAALRVPFTLVVLEIEQLASLAPKIGREGVERILAEAATTLGDVLRTSDFLFRHRRHQILAVLGGAAPEHAKRLAENLRWVLGTRSFRPGGGLPIRVTVSAGVAVHDGHPDYQPTLQRAQEALAQAIAAGGDRCHLAPPPA